MADIDVGDESRPAPELVAAVGAWRQTMEALAGLARDCSPADLRAPTECPGWDVRAQFAHVIGLERAILGRPDEPLDVPPLPHVRNDLGRSTEVSVIRRKAFGAAELAAELEDVTARRVAGLLDGRHRPDTPVRTPIGLELPLVRALSLRTFDCWTHEQDVRRALGRPGNLDSEAAHVAVAWMRRGFPMVVARGARVSPGSCVALHVDGPAGFTTAVRVEAASTGKPRGVELDAEQTKAAIGSADVVIRISTEAYMRRSGGRWSRPDTPVEVAGDEALAAAVIEALAVTP